MEHFRWLLWGGTIGRYSSYKLFIFFSRKGRFWDPVNWLKNNSICQIFSNMKNNCALKIELFSQGGMCALVQEVLALEFCYYLSLSQILSMFYVFFYRFCYFMLFFCHINVCCFVCYFGQTFCQFFSFLILYILFETSCETILSRDTYPYLLTYHALIVFKVFK